MEAKVRGWIMIIGALVAGYYAYGSGDDKIALLILALLALISGIHHIGKHKK
jgi:uncharacterized membrane protein